MRCRPNGFAIIFGAWFALSVLGQKLWRRPGRSSAWDRLHVIIPDWRFFAPDPGIYDQHVLVRGFDITGTASDWRELTRVEERRPAHAAWHLSQREEKAQFDVCAELFRFLERKRADGESTDRITRDVQLSVAYLTLLAYASARAPEASSVEVQFMVAISGGYDDEPPEIVFVSERHPLDVQERRRISPARNGKESI